MKTIYLCSMLAAVAAFAAHPAGAQNYGRVKTTFQTAEHWKPATDIRADAVMVYGTGDRPGETFLQRVKSWRDRGYVANFMTGIAWGEYKDYFTGKWDGKWHLDEGQKTMQGDTIWHGEMIPYIVPSRNYLKYFKEKHIKPVIDAGIDAIFLEEPEFWARAGYSESFKREWQDYYGFPWRPQHESAENTYLSNKLKYHLYYRALDEAFSYAKTYGKERGIDVKCYVPTHSLLNYSQWQIVSPEASLASMKSCDGYIAQVWTGTSREPNFYDGRRAERVFETAFLEYGCMESMTRPTNRKVFFLTDPIEDRARDWSDYKRNYEATFTAQLLYPRQDNYEVMPWPDRIYEGLYHKSADNQEMIHIPRFYSTQMQVMVNALQHMPYSDNEVSGTHGINVAMCNSLMFQRSPQPVQGYDDPQLSNFYGLALPLLKRGIPVGITHLENTGYREAWKGVKVLLLTYSNMKPMSPQCHYDIAKWVKSGGTLIYCGRDDDPFQSVSEWWNKGDEHYAAPSAHLFKCMKLDVGANDEGTYRYGKGKVIVIRMNPKEFVMNKDGDSRLLSALKSCMPDVQQKNNFVLHRRHYVIASVMDESPAGKAPLELKGLYIDLFNPELPVLKVKTVKPGTQSLLVDLNNVSKPRHPQVLASASRQYDEQLTPHTFSFVSKSPANTTNVMRILLPTKPDSVECHADGFSYKWDDDSRTLFLTFENDPDGVPVKLHW